MLQTSYCFRLRNVFTNHISPHVHCSKTLEFDLCFYNCVSIFKVAYEFEKADTLVYSLLHYKILELLLNKRLTLFKSIEYSII